MPLDLKIMMRTPGLAVETPVEREHLVLEREEVGAVRVGEFLRVVRGDDFAFAVADVVAVDGADGEVLAGDGEDFFFHYEGCLVGGVELAGRGLRAQGGVAGEEGGGHCCGGGVWEVVR